ncbi:glycoside hydrolase family 19 protein [Methanobrevibacter sp.]
MTKGVISAQKLVFNGTTKILGGMSNLLLKGVSGIFGKAGEGIKNVFGPIMSSVTEKIGPIFDSLKDKLGSVFSGISEKFKGFNFGKESKLIGPALPPGMKEPEDDSTFWEKTKKQWGSFKGSLGKGMLSLGRMVGPMAVAGAAMVAFEGALEGWGKAGEWFGSTIELGDKMKTKSKENEVLAKSIDPSATWDEVKKAYVNASGEIIRTSADMMKIGPVAVKTAEEIAKMTDAERKKYEEDLKLSQSAEEMAKSFSKTGTAIWDGTKYVDQYGRSIEATATIGQKTASAIGGALEAVSFGMLDGQHMAHKTAEIFKSIGDWFDSNGLSDSFKSLKSFMGDYLSSAVDIIKSIFNLLSPVLDVAKTIFGGLVQYIAGIFKIITGIFTLDLGKMSEGVKTIMNGFIDIITSPVKLVVGIIDKLFGTDLMSTFNTVIDVVKSFSTMVIDVFTGIIRAVGDILGGIIDVITAPFKALMAWFNGEMDFSDAMSSMLTSLGEGMKKIGKGLVDIVASPFNSFIDWITDKLSFILGNKEEQQAENIAKNASEEDKLAGDKLSEKLDFGGVSDYDEDEIRKKVSEHNLTEKDIMQMISGDEANNDEKESLVKILNEMKQGFISATEENVKAGKSKEDIKDGDKLAKQLKINGMWDTSEKTIRERLTTHNISNTDIEKLIAANDTSSDEKDILLKILNERKQAESSAKVEVTALPAKAEGGSTGGLGDVFAKMIMPDLTKETPVATVGTDEFVFSKEMIQNAMKAKEASTNTSFSGISNVGQTLSNTASGVFEINKSIIESIGSILTGEKGPVEAFQEVGNTMASLLPQTTEYIVKGLGENASVTISGISSIGGIIVDSFKGILDGKTSLSEGILTVGDKIGEKAITPLQDTFENFSEGISDTFMGFTNMIGNTIQKVNDKAVGFVENVKSGGFVSAVKGAVADVSDWGAEKINNIKQSSKDNLELVRNAMKKQGFNNENYINATLGNVMKESGGKVISENLNYRTTSNDRIKSIFKSATAGKSDEEISAAKQNPQTFAEFVYGASTERGKAMGNTTPGDGWKYRGRGFIQLTGKNNYAAASKAIYKDNRLVENPDLVNNPEIAAEVTAWYMKTNTARMEKKTGINAETASLEDSTMLATSTIGGFNMQSQNGYQKELFGKSYSYAKHIANEPRTNSSIPPDKSVKIASNNIVAQGTAQQMQSTVNNTTNNTVGAIDNQALNRLVAINQAQLNYQNKMAQEAYKQTKQSQKDYKADIDRNDQARILEIANRKV